MSSRTVKILACSYLVKTLVLGIAWLAVPDLPHKAAAKVREAWAWVVTD